jgi:hypothetical protein
MLNEVSIHVNTLYCSPNYVSGYPTFPNLSLPQIYFISSSRITTAVASTSKLMGGLFSNAEVQDRENKSELMNLLLRRGLLEIRAYDIKSETVNLFNRRLNNWCILRRLSWRWTSNLNGCSCIHLRWPWISCSSGLLRRIRSVTWKSISFPFSLPV